MQLELAAVLYKWERNLPAHLRKERLCNVRWNVLHATSLMTLSQLALLVEWHVAN